jgi:hypothetical protein
MRAPILVFTGGLRVYASRTAAERALSVGGARPVDAFDATGRPLHLSAGGRNWFGLTQKHGVRLEAASASADGRRQLRSRLAEALVQQGVSRPWAEGAPWGALVAEATRRLPGLKPSGLAPGSSGVG